VLTVANLHLIFIDLNQSFICEMIAHHKDGKPCTLSLCCCDRELFCDKIKWCIAVRSGSNTTDSYVKVILPNAVARACPAHAAIVKRVNMSSRGSCRLHGGNDPI